MSTTSSSNYDEFKESHSYEYILLKKYKYEEISLNEDSNDLPTHKKESVTDINDNNVSSTTESVKITEGKKVLSHGMNILVIILSIIVFILLICIAICLEKMCRRNNE